MPTYQKRFECGGEVWRLSVEGNLVRVDEWIDGWAVYAQGRIRKGAIVDLAVIGDLQIQTPMPKDMQAMATRTLRRMDGYRDYVPTSSPHARRPFNSGYYASAAARLGMSVADYAAKKEAGLSWCSRGRHWVPGRVRPGGLVCDDCVKPQNSPPVETRFKAADAT